MQTTREYHVALREWRDSLPFTDEERLAGTRNAAAAAIGDLDFRLYGKTGVFFNMGTCFYELIRSHSDKHHVYGFGKILLRSPGAILSLFDDVMGITFGEACLTKNIKVQFLVAPEELYARTLRLEAKSAITIESTKSTIVTRAEIKSDSGKVLAWSEATFIQTPELKRQLSMEASLEEQGKERTQIWNRLANVRVAGQSPDDSSMSFVLRTTAGAKTLLAPTDWVPDQGYRICEQTHLLDGRVQLGHIGCKHDSCRAVAHPLITAEGPKGLMHGGCGATTWLDVLSHEVDLGSIKMIALTYRRPIPLLSTVFIYWNKVNADSWRCELKDPKNNLLQVVDVTLDDAFRHVSRGESSGRAHL